MSIERSSESKSYRTNSVTLKYPHMHTHTHTHTHIIYNKPMTATATKALMNPA